MDKKKEYTIEYVEFSATSGSEVAVAKRFYDEVFHWTFQDWGDDYIDTASSGLPSGFNADPEQRTKHPLAVIYASDLSAASNRIVAAGGRITKETFSFPGGKRFHFTDPLGNELAVWSDQ